MHEHDIEVIREPVTIEQGDVFHVRTPLEFGAPSLKSGDVLTVANISQTSDGIQFEFTIDSEPGRIEKIMQSALESNIDVGHLTAEKDLYSHL